MKAEDIKAGMKYTMRRNDRIVGGWKATGDAVVEGNEVFVPVEFYDGSQGSRVFDLGHEVPMDKKFETKTVYVVDENGATFAYTNLDIALSNLRSEIEAGMEPHFYIVHAPGYLEGDALAEWCASDDSD